MRTLFLLLLFPAFLYAEPLAPWSTNHDRTDIPRQYVQDIREATCEYSVAQGGTMDGRNCRSPQGVWTPFEQTWESNRAVRMENIGDTDIVNPWLSNGRNDFRDIRTIVARAIEPGMTDREKVIAIWWQQIQNRFHYEGDNNELSSPVKVLNTYGHNTCGNDSICMAGLWKTAGFKVAPARLVGHCVTQVFYDGEWHLLDGDMHSMYLLRDNETIASEQDVVRDHDLIRRTHTQGILQPQGRAGDEWQSSIYVFEGEIAGDRNADEATTMDMTLRPGEALVWRWGHTEPAKFFGSADHRFTNTICNGLWEYQPDFTKSTWRNGADTIMHIVSEAEGLKAEDGENGEIVWTIRSPYVMVGGKLEVDGVGVRFEISWDGRTWESVGNDLDALFPSVGPARYAYQLRCRLSGRATLRRLRVVNDLQMAPLSLPEMGIGENQFTYSDESTGDRHVRIVHDWIERSASAPPAAPAAPLSPPDGGEVEGTAVIFEWRPASDADGDKIVDYHFELSSRPDMKWPLSMTFAKLISRTSDAGSSCYTLHDPGELNPDRKYYWRVRAKDAAGVWGDWSRTWSFTPRGPAHPLQVTLEYDVEENLGTLRWHPNPIGREPVSYRIYASDEKGFTASDEPYEVAAGFNAVERNESTDAPTQFPANFLVETADTQLAVIGATVNLAGANKVYYRVVAVDQAGNCSGPSDYAEAQRPVIYSQPAPRAKIGEEYLYQVRAIRSLGDARTRVVDGREVMKYWDIEHPRYKLERGPSWLRIDSATGQISGTPDRAGQFQITVVATLQRERRALDPAQLQWGIERVLESFTEAVGAAKQDFTIDVAP